MTIFFLTFCFSHTVQFLFLFSYETFILEIPEAQSLKTKSYFCLQAAVMPPHPPKHTPLCVPGGPTLCFSLALIVPNPALELGLSHLLFMAPNPPAAPAPQVPVLPWKQTNLQSLHLSLMRLHPGLLIFILRCFV